MKSKRLLFTAIMLIAVLLVGIFAFTACGDDKGKGDVTVVIACDGSNAVYKVDADKVDGNGVLPVLIYLKDNKGLNVKYADGMYGVYLTEVGTFVDGTDGKYVYIFTSVAKDQDVSEYKKTVEYDGQTLVSSGVGISEMSVEQGAVIYIGAVAF